MGVFTRPALFEHFFPREAALYERTIQDNCTAQYLAYKVQPVTWRSCQAVLNCILDNVSETHKIQLGVTGLILGLTPTILSWLGSGIFEMSMLSSRRPMLSMLLSLGAPVFSPASLFTQWRPADILDSRPLAFKTPPIVRQHHRLVSSAQYVLAIGAIANTTHVGYLLSYMAVTLSSGCQNRYFVLLWLYVALAVHVSGYLAFHTRASWARTRPINNNNHDDKPGRWSFTTAWQLMMVEVRPCISGGRRILKWGLETSKGLFLVNFTTILVLGHVIWGTIILGSTTLVEPVDAVMLIGRFAASALVCKVVLMFELAGMREVTTLEEQAV